MNISEDITLYATWAELYTVTLLPNGGTGETVVQTALGGTDIALRTGVFTRTGYGFTGWNTMANGGGTEYTDGETITVSGNIVLYAQWGVHHTVTFDANADDAQGETLSVSAPQGSTITLSANGFTRNGWRFTGWNTAANGTGTAYTNSQRITLSGDLRLYAQWQSANSSSGNEGGTGTPLISHEITLNQQEGGTAQVSAAEANSGTLILVKIRLETNSVLNSIDVRTEDDQALTVIEIIENSVYAFNMPDSAVTVTPDIKPPKTLSFSGNAVGVTGSVTSITELYGTNVTIPENGFTLNGCHFVKWNTKPDGSGIDYAPNATITLTADITLYAQWGCYVTFDKNNDSASGSMEQREVLLGKTFTVPASTFTLADCHFVKWNTASDGSGTAYAPNATITPTADTTLYAQWGCYVTFNKNNDSASGSMEQREVLLGKNFTVPESGFTLADCHFVKWNTASNGNGTDYAPNVTITPTADTTLYAQWGCYVTFNKNNSSASGSMTQREVLLGKSFTVPTNSFSNSSYSFDKWNTKADGTGTSYSANTSTTTITSNTILYACWKNNGSISISVSDFATRMRNFSQNGVTQATITLTGVTNNDLKSSYTSGTIGYTLYAYSGVYVNLTINGTATIVDDYAFYNNNTALKNLSKITLPSTITSIGNYAFCYACIDSITLPSSLTTIGNTAFSLCSKLTSITIPSSVTKIGCYVFAHNSNLTSVTFQNTNNWYATTNSNYTNGTTITVTDATTNATNLKNVSYGAWYNKYLYRN